MGSGTGNAMNRLAAGTMGKPEADRVAISVCRSQLLARKKLLALPTALQPAVRLALTAAVNNTTTQRRGYSKARISL